MGGLERLVGRMPFLRTCSWKPDDVVEIVVDRLVFAVDAGADVLKVNILSMSRRFLRVNLARFAGRS